jgi:outer membrane receptor for ferrienterochelin and colicins
VYIKGTTVGTTTDGNGYYSLEIPVEYEGRYLFASYLGYSPDSVRITSGRKSYHFNLSGNGTAFKEVVISGTMKEVSRTESPIPVEVYTPSFFKKNPTANIFEALTMVNGVQPQLN